MKLYLKEFFGHFDILVTFLLWFASALLFIPSLTDWHVIIAIPIGMLLYFISEYLTHRFLFHLPPPKNRFLLKVLKRLHYDHHEVPNELSLLFLPIWYSLPQMLFYSALVYWLFQSLAISAAFFFGVTGALLYYEWAHYVAHRPIKPLTPWGRWMKKVHTWHHFKSEHFWFGVSNPSMDYLLGTFKDEKHVERSATARNLLKQGYKDES